VVVPAAGGLIVDPAHGAGPVVETDSLFSTFSHGAEAAVADW
jgi:hypothetical protein